MDGKSYLDYVMSWGPLVLGHAPKRVVEALRGALDRGTSYGAPTPGEVELAREITAAVPSMEMLRLVSSGTEAAMSALRVARGFTGRSKLVKFEGCYHGHADSLLVKAGSGGATFGVPDSLGVPADLARLTLTAPFNDLDAVKAMLDAEGRDVAAVILEPVVGNMGVVPPAPGFLAGLRELTQRHGALLVFDEVITGFRVAYGGAQARYGVTPDLTILGKIIGGGMPVGAYGGRREIMERISPLGGVYQAGTLSGNPLAVTAGLETLRALREPGVYDTLESRAAALEAGLREAAARAGVPATVNRVGSMLTGFFTDGPVTDWTSAARADRARYGGLLPQDAGPRRLPGAVPVRGGVPVPGPLARRRGDDGRGRARGVLSPVPAPLFRQILHATDFSRASAKAFTTAVEVARATGATLTIAHVLTQVLPVATGEDPILPETYERVHAVTRTAAQKELDRLVAKAEAAGIRATGRAAGRRPARRHRARPQVPPGRPRRDRHPRADRARPRVRGQRGGARGRPGPLPRPHRPRPVVARASPARKRTGAPERGAPVACRRPGGAGPSAGSRGSWSK